MEETNNNWPGMDHYDAVNQWLSLASEMLGSETTIPTFANGTTKGDSEKVQPYEDRNCAETMGLKFDDSLSSKEDNTDAENVIMELDSPLSKELLDKWTISTEELEKMGSSLSAIPKVPLYEISPNTNSLTAISPKDGTIIGTTTTATLDGTGYINTMRTTNLGTGYASSSGPVYVREAYPRGPRNVDKYSMDELQRRFLEEMYYEGGVEPGTPMEKWNRVFLLEFIHWIMSDAIPD